MWVTAVRFRNGGNTYTRFSFSGTCPGPKNSADTILGEYRFTLPIEPKGLFSWFNAKYKRALAAWTTFFQNLKPDHNSELEELLSGLFEAGVRGETLSVPQNFSQMANLATTLTNLRQINPVAWTEIAGRFYRAGQTVGDGG